MNNAYSLMELANKSAAYHERMNLTRSIEAKVMVELTNTENIENSVTYTPPLEFSELAFNDQARRETYVLVFLVSFSIIYRGVRNYSRVSVQCT